MDEDWECLMWLMLGVLFVVLLGFGFFGHWNWILLFVFLEAMVICFAKLASIVGPALKFEDDGIEPDY